MLTSIYLFVIIVPLSILCIPARNGVLALQNGRSLRGDPLTYCFSSLSALHFVNVSMILPLSKSTKYINSAELDLVRQTATGFSSSYGNDTSGEE